MESLAAFLDSKTDGLCEVAIDEKLGHQESVTVVGNWFFAEAVNAEITGYRQTIFTRHAPTVLDRMGDFDAEFNELLEASKVDKHDSRRHALKLIAREIADLRKKLGK